MAPGAQLETNSGSPNSTTRNDGETGQSFVQKYLNDCKSYYSCIYCRTHVANHDELVSRSFQGNRSRAYLFNTVVNISSGPAVQRELNTGSHAVADIFCKNCGTTMGWKYEKAYVETQKYKEGKYIIELAHVVRENRHLEFDKRDILLATGQNQQQRPSQPTTMASNCANGSSMGCHYKRGSASPPTYNGPWSSPASSTNDEEVVETYEEDDEDELMFPFYDDLCADRSSYPSFTSSRSQQNRVRRSIYLDSTPYDWKYSASATASDTASSSPNSPSITQANRSEVLSSNDIDECSDEGPRFSDFPSPSTSSASDETHEAANFNNKNNNKSNKTHPKIGYWI